MNAETARPTDMTSELGFIVACPVAFGIMQRATDPAALTDREVIALVEASDHAATFTATDWAIMAGRQTADADAGRDRARVAARKLHNKDRATRSGRSQLAADHKPSGSISHRIKLRRTASLTFALARRARRMAELGEVLSHNSLAWFHMTTAARTAHKAKRDALTQTAGFLSVFEDDDSEGVDHLDFLYRFGRAPREDRATHEALLGA